MSNLPRLLKLREIIGDSRAKPPLPGIIPISKAEIYRRIAAGRFPQPIRLGPRSVAWREADIQAFLDSLSPEAEA